MSAGEVEHINSLNKNEAGEEDFTNFPARVFAASVVDPETGENLFALDELDAINALPFTLIQRVVKAACDFSGISADAVEETRKNSSTDPNSDSSTD